MDWDSAGIGAVLAAFIAGLFAFLTQKTRAKVDESALIMGQWKELLAAHEKSAQGQIDSLTARLTAAEKDIADMRREHAKEISEIKKEAAAEMAKLLQENEGLRRAIAQNSQSTAQLLSNPDAAAVSRASRKARGEDQP